MLEEGTEKDFPSYFDSHGLPDVRTPNGIFHIQDQSYASDNLISLYCCT
ncbi:hypothetical protein BVRB_9g217420 [Beta vulgaris subsp. vulgaris]|nr:hypothetical protein BVRB_9g217420 [Beta vulgaris subsp. vulgaris]